MATLSGTFRPTNRFTSEISEIFDLEKRDILGHCDEEQVICSPTYLIYFKTSIRGLALVDLDKKSCGSNN